MKTMVKLACLVMLNLMFIYGISSSQLPEPKWVKTDCNPMPGKYSPNSLFAMNLENLLQNLSNQTMPPAGYRTTSNGNGTDIVYGRAQCREDIKDSKLCEQCIKLAVERMRNTSQIKNCDDCAEEKQEGCNFKYKAIWFDYCQVVHSGLNFSSANDYKGKRTNWGKGLDSRNVTNPEKFKSFIEMLLQSVENTRNSSGNFFATGKMKYSQNETIYCMVQCSKDRRRNECSFCLNNLINDFVADINGRSSGIEVSEHCDARFELHRFFDVPSPKIWVWIAWGVGLFLFMALTCWGLFVWWRRRPPKVPEPDEPILPPEPTVSQPEDFTWSTIERATGGFSEENYLGRGGCGIVYKGTLPDGRMIAAKKLSRQSRHGDREFQNEIVCLVRLQHRNLVRLFGYSKEGDKRVLVYEYMPNGSLDQYIFNRERRLSWGTFYSIIKQIVRGMLYLHQDSQVKIIHRDLKPSNVLLDDKMVAHISDFDIARIFHQDESEMTERRPGTIGYMAPEYQMNGVFSEKSDVFSFGVVVLEILIGQSNHRVAETGRASSLLAHAWTLWSQGRGEESIEESLLVSGALPEMLRSMQVALLCVQASPARRPRMTEVDLFLDIQVDPVPYPEPPGWVLSSSYHDSVQQLTLTEDWPR